MGRFGNGGAGQFRFFEGNVLGRSDIDDNTSGPCNGSLQQGRRNGVPGGVDSLVFAGAGTDAHMCIPGILHHTSKRIGVARQWFFTLSTMTLISPNIGMSRMLPRH